MLFSNLGKGGMKVILNKITALCEKKGISISKLEKECGLGNATIARWDESAPRVNNLKKVADYFGVDIKYFLEE